MGCGTYAVEVFGRDMALLYGSANLLLKVGVITFGRQHTSFDTVQNKTHPISS
jgi:hypothetical protein